jgi:hypothetical protein
MEQNVLQTLLDRRQALLENDADVELIAKSYHFTPEEVKRAKEYLFVNPDLLDSVNVEMWQLAQAGNTHPSVQNFLEHEIIESDIMGSMQIPFNDTAARDAAWPQAHSETLSRQQLPPFAYSTPRSLHDTAKNLAPGF